MFSTLNKMLYIVDLFFYKYSFSFVPKYHIQIHTEYFWIQITLTNLMLNVIKINNDWNMYHFIVKKNKNNEG